MNDFVALVVGIAHYPKLPGWDVPGDRTANDAVAVTRELIARGAEPQKIKLLLSAQKNLPTHISGVSWHPAEKEVLEKFITEELGNPPFDGRRFFLFCSGHGISAEGRPETLIITADSSTPMPNKRVFRCLGIEQLRVQLQGMPQFSEQLFCINACRTPAEWTTTRDDQIFLVQTLTFPRIGRIRQPRFFSAPDLEPAPVEDSGKEFSNGFVETVANCIKLAEWPPGDHQWNMLLHVDWPATQSFDIRGLDPYVFKRLYDARYRIDRQRQSVLVDAALKHIQKWNELLPETGPADLWRTTFIDLHACAADRLDVLMQYLEDNVFTDRVVVGGVQRVDRWPARKQEAGRREKQLIGELTYCLTENRRLTDPGKIIQAVAEFAPGVRVVFVEVDGPCEAEDEELIKAMLNFWQSVIAAALERGTRVPCLPLLLVGHVDPNPREDAPRAIDVTRFYHPDVLDESDERRLSLVRGTHLHKWLDEIIPKQNLIRGDVERELAQGLGNKMIEDVAVRMGPIIDFVNARAR